MLSFKPLPHAEEALSNVTNARKSSADVYLEEGTIIEMAKFTMPLQTKNKAKARDPEMHQAQKGKQWFFGLKAHIGVDARTGLTHSL